jgi:hypothetical protein
MSGKLESKVTFNSVAANYKNIPVLTLTTGKYCIRTTGLACDTLVEKGAGFW